MHIVKSYIISVMFWVFVFADFVLFVLIVFLNLFLLIM